MRDNPVVINMARDDLYISVSRISWGDLRAAGFIPAFSEALSAYVGPIDDETICMVLKKAFDTHKDDEGFPMYSARRTLNRMFRSTFPERRDGSGHRYYRVV